MHKKMRLAILIAVVLVTISSAAYLLIPHDYEYYEKITNHIYDFNALIVVITVFTAFMTHKIEGVRRKCWLFMSLGVLFWFLGDLTWTLMVYLGIDPFPSVADVLYMLGYVGMGAAVISKFSHSLSRVEKDDWFNGVFVAAVLLIVSASSVLIPILISDDSVLNKAVMIFYPVADILIIFFTVIIVSAIGFETESMPWMIIGIGICFWAVADTFLAYFEWSEIQRGFDLINIVFIMGIHSIGLGAYYRHLVSTGHIEDGAAKK